MTVNASEDGTCQYSMYDERIYRISKIVDSGPPYTGTGSW